MNLFFLTSVMCIVIVFMAFIAVVTMFEVSGRGQGRFDVRRMKRTHKINGILYFVVFGFVAYYCLSFIALSGTELSSRGLFHSIFALTGLVLFGVKFATIRGYRQLYHQVNIMGLSIALLTFGMAGTSAGYYLLVTEFETGAVLSREAEDEKTAFSSGVKEPAEGTGGAPAADAGSIERGKQLFEVSCAFCHYAFSTETKAGPGLLGILKKPLLPVSERPATPENIKKQLMNPYKNMPSFSYLSGEEIRDIIIFLGTL